MKFASGLLIVILLCCCSSLIVARKTSPVKLKQQQDKQKELLKQQQQQLVPVIGTPVVALATEPKPHHHTIANCASESLLGAKTWTFKNHKIVCSNPNKDDMGLCSSKLLVPQVVICNKKASAIASSSLLKNDFIHWLTDSTQPASGDNSSPDDELVEEEATMIVSDDIRIYTDLWECEPTTNSWTVNLDLECPINTSPCLDSMKKCHILFKPWDTIMYLAFVTMMLTFFIGLFFCVAYVIYQTQCFFIVETTYPSNIKRPNHHQ